MNFCKFSFGCINGTFLRQSKRHSFLMRNKIISGKGETLDAGNDASLQSAKQVLMDTVIGSKNATKKSRRVGRRRNVTLDTMRYNMMSLKRTHDFALQDVESTCSNS